MKKVVFSKKEPNTHVEGGVRQIFVGGMPDRTLQRSRKTWETPLSPANLLVGQV